MMKNFKFKTNINCGGCIETVTPHLDKVKEIDHWKVDTKNPDKILTVEGNEHLSEKEVMKAVKEAGYNIERKKDGFLKGLFS